MQNELSQRGENLFSVIITRFYGRENPIFRPQFLGDKVKNYWEQFRQPDIASIFIDPNWE